MGRTQSICVHFLSAVMWMWEEGKRVNWGVGVEGREGQGQGHAWNETQ